MNTAFLDTGYVLALELANDQNHASARQHWQSVEDGLPSLVTTSYVFDEIVTFFNSRGYHQKAVEVGISLLESSSLEIIHVDEDLFSRGWLYLHQDKRYSLTDCISFVVMGSRGIKTTWSFDQHFVRAGFEIEP